MLVVLADVLLNRFIKFTSKESSLYSVRMVCKLYTSDVQIRLNGIRSIPITHIRGFMPLLIAFVLRIITVFFIPGLHRATVVRVMVLVDRRAVDEQAFSTIVALC